MKKKPRSSAQKPSQEPSDKSDENEVTLIDKEQLKAISIAGLFHDIGKFAERAFAVNEVKRDSIKQEYNYEHGYYTEQILHDLFQEGVKKQIGNEADGMCSIADLAARHHKPRSVLETIIQQADHIAAGHEREPTDKAARYKTVGRERKSQIPLISVLSRVGISGQFPDESQAGMRYRIRVPPLDRDLEDEEIYPCPPQDYESLNVRNHYKDHWNNFKKEIKGQKSGERPLDIIEHFETIFELCRLYQWCLPESARACDLSDVSLFEHQKATAAIAAALYCYHTGSNTLNKTQIQKRETEKFLLFCGDLSGIQQFVYQISSKGAYKMLKGRSFFIQLLAEILARKYGDEFHLTPANVLYCNGGKFYLLLPNLRSVRQTLETMTDAVNQELFDLFNGEVFLRTAFEKMSAADLTRQNGRTLSEIWDKVGREVFLRDRSRYSTLAARDYERIFGVAVHTDLRSCPVCHCTMTPEYEPRNCATCGSMELIGKNLKTTRCYIVMSGNGSAVVSKKPIMKIFGRNIWFFETQPDALVGECLIWALNTTSFAGLIREEIGTGRINAAPLIAGGNHGFDKEFQEIAAETAQGIHRLGILRMDVDNLGKIFRQGLKNYYHLKVAAEERIIFHSLGRITTLSWQLAFFFGGLVPKFIDRNAKWQGKAAVVYAGGDDLFVMGAWDIIPDIALHIKTRFARFCCHNPVFSMSGGMVMTGGKFPIYKSADMAGEAVQTAKNNKTIFNRSSGKAGEKTKNSFTFLNSPMHWDEFIEIQARKDFLMALLADSRNRPLLTRLQAIAASWDKSRQSMEREATNRTMQQIQQQLLAERWRWLMVYSLARFGESRNESTREEIRNLQHFILNPVAASERRGIDLLGVLGRWCELLLRKPEDRKGEE